MPNNNGNKNTHTKTNPSGGAKQGVSSGVSYYNKNKLLVTISAEGGVVPSVQGVLPAEYSFSVKNQFEPLLSADSAMAQMNKGVQAIVQLANSGNSDISLVPYSPQIWMGADPLTISEMTLYFVCYKDPKTDVHDPLMRLLAMGLPRSGGSAAGAMNAMGIKFNLPAADTIGILAHPPAVTVQIGSVINWSPCYLANVTVTEKAPFSSQGFGFQGEAKFSIIRRDYIFAEGFNTSAQKAARPAKVK